MIESKLAARVGAVLAVVLSVMLALAGHAAVAVAKELPLVDARPASLTIHKSEGDPFTQFGDPSRDGAESNRDPVEGVRFQIQRIDGLDLATSKGWQEATNLKVEDFYAGGAQSGRLGAPRDASTDVSGNARFDIPGDQLGFYYVTELPGPAQDRGMSVIKPFVVSIPRTETLTRSRWEYDVQVNAKDQKLSIRKAEDRQEANVGETVRYTMSASSPAPQSDGTISRYEIIDPLQEHLDYVGGPEVTLTNGHGQQELLTDEDFDITVHKERIVRMTLTESGLKKLATYRTGNPAADVTLSFEAKVNARPSNGRIDNESYLLTYGYPEFDEDKPTKGVKSDKVTLIVPNTPVPTDPTTGSPTTTQSRTNNPIIPIPGGKATVTDTPEPTVTTKVLTPVPEIQPTVPETTRVVETTVKNPMPGEESGGHGGSDSNFGAGSLAMTGANVILLLILGSLLILSGLFLTMRHNPTDPQAEV